jgi:phage-related protein
MKPWNLKTLYTGAKFTICAIEENGKCEVQSFIDSLTESEQKKIVALLRFAAQNGVPGNTEKFKKLTAEDIYEFKAHQTRIFCFFDKGRIIILSNGFTKKQNKTPKNEIAKANEILRLFKLKG